MQDEHVVHDDGGVSVDPLIDKGLRSSSRIFDITTTLMQASSPSIAVSRIELRTIKKMSLDMNRAFARYVKQSNQIENRLMVEIHLLRQASHRDAIDRDANRARVYEYLRKYRLDDERQTAAISTNPLYTPSMAATQVDRAMSTVARIEASISSLSPTGKLTLHGAGLLTAHEL